jgi:hypothetical protein
MSMIHFEELRGKVVVANCAGEKLWPRVTSPLELSFITLTFRYLTLSPPGGIVSQGDF